MQPVDKKEFWACAYRKAHPAVMEEGDYDREPVWPINIMNVLRLQ
jgi:hypothetical protein